jgi:chemotaxis protein CheX
MAGPSQMQQAVIDSTQCVFSTMLGCQVHVVAGECQADSLESSDLSSTIGMTGDITGTVILHLSQSVAVGIAETLLGQPIDGINDDVRDVTGELANLIAGNAKERMENKAIVLGLPTIICGPKHRIFFEPGVTVQDLSFQTPWGQLHIQLAFRDTSKHTN